MSKHRPVLEAIQIIIFVMVTELMDERYAIQFMQWFQSRPYTLVERGKELLDVWIVWIASFQIHNNPIVIGALHFTNNGIDKTLVS